MNKQNGNVSNDKIINAHLDNMKKFKVILNSFVVNIVNPNPVGNFHFYRKLCSKQERRLKVVPLNFPCT